MKILVVDDDVPLGDFVQQALREEGHVVDIARNCGEARGLAMVHPYDGMVLDVMLPDGTGFGLLEELRRMGNRVPVLMLTSRDSKEDVIRGLDAGADDYLTKPFVIAELKARVRALMRRGGATRTEVVQFGDLVLDRLTHTVSKDGRKIRLTPKEYSLLEFFMLNAERIITRTELLQKVWDLHFDPGSNVVDTHVARLRAKLDRFGVQARLSTIRGTGFIMTTAAGERVGSG